MTEHAPVRARVITVSDRSASGARDDLSGPVAVDALRAAGLTCDDAIVIADGTDTVEAALRVALAAGYRLVITTGGTGIGPRDRTPEGTERVVTRIVPGISELLRREGAQEHPAAMLSRGIAGVVDPPASADGALIVNLPGSPGAVASGVPIVLTVAQHVLDQVAGGDHP